MPSTLTGCRYASSPQVSEPPFGVTILLVLPEPRPQWGGQPGLLALPHRPGTGPVEGSPGTASGPCSLQGEEGFRCTGSPRLFPSRGWARPPAPVRGQRPPQLCGSGLAPIWAWGRDAPRSDSSRRGQLLTELCGSCAHCHCPEPCSEPGGPDWTVAARFSGSAPGRWAGSRGRASVGPWREPHLSGGPECCPRPPPRPLPPAFAC